jgi:MFS family permease
MTSRTRQFWLLCGLTAVAMASKSMLEPLVPLLGLSLGSSTALIGALVSSAFLLPLLLAIPMGNLVDQWGPRGLIAVGAVGLALAPALVAAVPGLAMLFLAQVLVGLAHLAIVVSAQALVGAYGGEGGRESGFAWFTSFASAGQFAGPLLAGLLVDASTFRIAFAVAGLGGAVVAVGARWLTADATPARGRRASQAWVRRRDLADVSTRGVAVAVLLSFGVLLAMGAFTALLPVYLERLAFSATAIGFFLSLRPLTAIVLRPLLPHLVRWLGGRSRAMALVSAAVALGMGTIALASGGLAFALASMAVGSGSALSQPLSMAMTVEQVRDDRIGLALGLRLSANRLAQFASPLIFGLLAQIGSFALAFASSAAAVAAIGTWVVLLYRREP